MYLLDTPKYSIGDYFDEMLKNRHDNAKNNFLKTRLLLIKSQLIEAEGVYQKFAEKKELYNINEQVNIRIPDAVDLDDKVPGKINADEMEKVYSGFFVDKPNSRNIGRKVYDSILSNTYYNLCPYCSHREVKTVDHYLPKTKFISFAITPINLLPCCSDCNKDKSDKYILTEDKMLIHPYFEDLRNINWLTCKVNENMWPITFTYNVSDGIYDLVLKTRIQYQFELLNLGELYADNATREFNKRVKSLVKEFNSDPSKKALDFINDNFESYHLENPNSWQTMLFNALANSRWFLEEAMRALENYYLK